MAITDFSASNIAMFKLVSGGAAYDITLPFQADSIEWWNNTKYATNSQNLQGFWSPYLTDPTGGALIIARGTTDLTSTLETTNGVTELDDGSGFADNHRTPTAITAANPPVVTSNAHGLTNGQWVRATNFVTSPVSKATGMEQLNNRQFIVGLATTNTFALYDPETGLAVDATAYTAFVNNGIAQFTLVGQDLNTQSAAPVFQYTLGTGIMGADGDVIIIRAMQVGQSTNLGDVGA